MSDIYEVAETVANKSDFLSFMGHLVSDLQENREEWENDSLETFLEAFAGWVQDMDGYYTGIGKVVPTNIDWKVLSDMFVAARTYE